MVSPRAGVVGGSADGRGTASRLVSAHRRHAAAAVVAAAALGYAAHHPSPPLLYPLLAGLAAVVVSLVVRTPAAAVQVVALRRGAVSVVEMLPEHLDRAARLHLAALPHGFFADLGPRFLRAYYAAFLASPHAVALAAVSGGQLLGVVVGATRPRAHRRWVLRHRGWRLAALGIAALVVRPRVALWFIRTRVHRYIAAWRRGRAGSPEEASPEPSRDPAVLSHVAVLDGARGEGIGRELTSAFVREAGRAGADRVVLVTLDGGAGAGQFYAKEGWHDEGVRVGQDGQRMRFFSHAASKGEQ